ncbi:glycerol-3-phosphate 1-O-acyltransferase PlsY [Ectothiorhodospira variabilis]|uniref:glycerol-3-phosphate 1-O-acyltransferase PlsY n=1 Tax=Ectothiorhodospira variabilis TaxID=505694 RepID=UPI001EFAED22|nr:glycerol-3-phosphate 1-O-acyltransferase PlsY [Ectothiorhodospira variabilis]MCG5493526.1 glycerol-3-phosphate 1-O-acyltransferase PlsY [Ectothiorhodospira variabilis]MCG5502855.1 glycerol-3-phosphate 1-O-acyltransferase PlsY [Ectothiorhodospira variabilis]MCG5506357.1 glycerol-3-phosphate 1-O-acyltransferase PlsY [Ectothiorhodospira variabilis]
MILQLILIIAAYLIGSLSTAIITCKLLGLPDPRTQGSGNPGATNVLRSGGKKAAIITLTGDLLKGLIPVLIAQAFGLSGLALALVALAAFLGHLFPAYHGFKGGKGVATGLGVLLGMHWAVGVAALVTWLLAAGISRISSMGALVAATLTPIWIALILGDFWLTMTGCIMMILLYWRHWSNIQRILAGTEPKIGRKS